MRGFEAVFDSISSIDEKLKEAIKEVCYETAVDMEAYAKENRQWIDRTAQARAGLNGKIDCSTSVCKAQIWQDLYGNTGEEYGYFLENYEKFHGKYAILKKTQSHFQDVFFNDVINALSQTISSL